MARYFQIDQTLTSQHADRDFGVGMLDELRPKKANRDLST
jgi:hypothetical protein